MQTIILFFGVVQITLGGGFNFSDENVTDIGKWSQDETFAYWDDYMQNMYVEEVFENMTHSRSKILDDKNNILLTIQHDSMDREAILHLPNASTGGILPLVLSLHPLGNDMYGQAVLDGFMDVSDNENFLLVYPNGIAGGSADPIGITTSGKSWNAGSCCPTGTTRKIDDVGFIKTLIKYLIDNISELSGGQMQIDTSSIFATGFSNGGFMSNRLACEAPELFAAIGPVASVIANSRALAWPEDPYGCPTNNVPVPTIHFHGTLDFAVPWKGNSFLGFQSVPDYIDERKELANAKFDRGDVTLRTNKVTCTSYGTGASNFTMCVHGRGHCWPGQAHCDIGFSATEMIWQFFKDHVGGRRRN